VSDGDPVAVGGDFEYDTAPDEFLMVRCRQCRLIYLDPRPAHSEMPRIYPDNYHAFDFQPQKFGLVFRVRHWLVSRQLLRWCRGLPTDARILDVGCGDGFHLEILRDYGAKSWTCEGLDADARAVAPARARGLTVHEGTVDSLELPNAAYHLILMVMTVEHLDEPAATLRQVSRWLAPGGKLVIVTDNAASPDTWLFGGRHWGGYHFPRHTYLFDRTTLAKLGEAAGLTVERVSTAMSPVNWTYSVRNWLQDWGAPNWLVRRFSLQSVFTLGIFTMLDSLLAVVGRGGNLHGVFRKPTREAQA
jgi:SAM-dependent methyltransferase